MTEMMDWTERKKTENVFRIIELSSVDDLIKLRGLSSAFLFRGQNDSNWKLETSLERQVKEKRSCPGQELIMLKEFQRRAHIYANNTPNYNNTIEWLALLQHYGCPTRLLDFSRSMFIGAYFAVENYLSDRNAAVWCINQIAMYHVYKESANLHFLASNDNNFDQDHLNNYINNPKKIDGTISITPFKMNDRLMVQQGTFVLPLNTNKTFEHNLFSTFGVNADIQNHSQLLKFAETDFMEIAKIMLSGSIIKLIIPSKIKKDILFFLKQFNIEPQYLFPGLEGLAKSQISFLDNTSSSFTYSQ